MNLFKVVMIGAAITAGAALAEDMKRTDPNSIARGELMETIGKNIGVVGGMAGGKADFDAAAAEAAKAALIEATSKIEATFKDQGAADPASEAKPEIWANWDDFLKKAKAANDAATALDVSSLDTLKAGMGALGGACKDCHTTYRVMKE
ncbi:MAG: cytochrome c [Tabrizicola sp.]